MRIVPASAKPKSEWSVKTVRNPMVRACKIASWHRLLRLPWPCTISMRSRMQIFLKMGKNEKTVGNVAER